MEPNRLWSGKLVSGSHRIVEIIGFELYDASTAPVTSARFNHSRSRSNARRAALLVRLEVVAVSLATAIGKLLTATRGRIVKPFFDWGSAWTSFRWKMTDAVADAGLFRSETIFVAAASGKHKPVASTGYRIVEKILNLSWAWPSLLRKGAHWSWWNEIYYILAYYRYILEDWCM